MRRRLNHIGRLHSATQILEAQADIEQYLVNHFTSTFKKDQNKIPEWYDEDLKKQMEMEMVVQP
ncbi:hypothetical protein QJS10_CPA06g01087 [Acorus calamus]|uniref:Uncharacterized protein n=1 Tax=Acorus calamus TaxID=4465 RepID=A0AAV9EKJ8_ACOCL|nr:hypothetical protein QJS10_CPA06g01087 [Acorus calamus]